MEGQRETVNNSDHDTRDNAPPGRLFRRNTIFMSSVRSSLVGVGFCVLTLAVVSGCEKSDVKADAKPPEAVTVTLGKAELRSVVRTVDITGTLWGDQDVMISAKVPGRVAEIFKDVGDRVAAGEPLVQIDRTDYELEQRSKALAVSELLARLGLKEMPSEDFDPSNVPTVRRAQLQAANAEAKFNRGRQLHDQPQPLISDQDFADLRTSWDVAKSGYDVELLTARSLLTEARSRQADLNIASQRLADTILRAPIVAPPAVTGTVTPTTNPSNTSFGVASRLVSVGEYVKDGTQLYRVIADDPVKLRANVPERFGAAVKVGQKVTLTIEAYPEVFTGKLTRINPQTDPASRTFQIEAIFANPDRKLQPGSFARAAIATQVQEGVLFVPQAAVTTFAGTNKVFTVVDGAAKESTVETGAIDGDLIEITKGMKQPGDVIVSGNSRLATGVPIKVQPTTAPATR